MERDGCRLEHRQREARHDLADQALCRHIARDPTKTSPSPVTLGAALTGYLPVTFSDSCHKTLVEESVDLDTVTQTDT